MRMLLGALALLPAALIAAASPALATCQVEQIAALPVTMSGERPMVSARINGADARFVADSGAFFSVISPGSAAQYGLRLEAPPYGLRMRGIGGDTATLVATVKSFTLAGIPIPNLQFIVGGSEPGGAGVLGQNVLGMRDVEYDLENGVIRLMQAKGCHGANLAYWAGTRPVSMIPIIGKAEAGFHTTGTVTLNGRKITAIFDTGASTSILSLSAAAAAGEKPGDPGVRDGGAQGGFGRHLIHTWIAPFHSLQIGGEDIRNTRLRIGEIGIDGADMLIGADFFLSHRVYVANGLHELFFTYDGGPVFNITPHDVLSADGAKLAIPVDPGGDPTDAAGFSRRGAAFAARDQDDRAIADFTRAITLAPDDATYRRQRAAAYLANGQPVPGGADLDKAIALAPDDVDARVLRAQQRLARDDRAGAIADLQAASSAAAPQADIRFALAALYGEAEAFDAAVSEYDRWIASHPEDSRRPGALNGRCWVRAEAGRDLDKALKDCDEALRAAPRDAAMLDSRGLVHLRLGDYDKAVADYDAALEHAPRAAWSLYGRGLAREHLGQQAQGEADIAAAEKIAPKLAAKARRLGL